MALIHGILGFTVVEDIPSDPMGQVLVTAGQRLPEEENDDRINVANT